MSENITFSSTRKRIDISLMSNYIENMQKKNEIISLISEIREKANKQIIEELKKNNITGLAPSHGAILVQLYRNDSLCMKDIAQLIGKDKSTVTALVNKLVKLNYIEKVKDNEDSRVTHLQLTEKGRGIENTFKSISKNLMKRVYKGFSDDEKNMLISQLNKLAGNL